jgi:hypothetical protein
MPHPQQSRSLYEVLQVEPDASSDDIKRSFRRLALRLHPDKQTGTAEERALAEKRFKEVNEAYSILSDVTRRARYDTYGVVDDDEDVSMPPPAEVYMSVDDLIEMTLGTRRRRYHLLSDEPFMMMVLQLLPAVVVLLMAFAESPSAPPSYAGLEAPFRVHAPSWPSPASARHSALCAPPLASSRLSDPSAPCVAAVSRDGRVHTRASHGERSRHLLRPRRLWRPRRFPLHEHATHRGRGRVSRLYREARRMRQAAGGAAAGGEPGAAHAQGPRARGPRRRRRGARHARM